MAAGQPRAGIHYFPQAESSRLAAMTALLTASDRAPAVLCWSDLDAIPLLDQAHRLGARVPQDFAIVGHDNTPVAGLSMVDQDGPQIGKVAAKALFSRLNCRKPAEHVLIAPRLIARAAYDKGLRARRPPAGR
jgi:LacI family transcriptional regulator